MTFTVYAHLLSLIRIIEECKTIFEKSSTAKVGDHIPCGYPKNIQSNAPYR